MRPVPEIVVKTLPHQLHLVALIQDVYLATYCQLFTEIGDSWVHQGTLVLVYSLQKTSKVC